MSDQLKFLMVLLCLVLSLLIAGAALGLFIGAII